VTRPHCPREEERTLRSARHRGSGRAARTEPYGSGTSFGRRQGPGDVAPDGLAARSGESL
jgi:hypothetical protein